MKDLYNNACQHRVGEAAILLQSVNSIASQILEARDDVKPLLYLIQSLELISIIERGVKVLELLSFISATLGPQRST